MKNNTENFSKNSIVEDKLEIEITTKDTELTPGVEKKIVNHVNKLCKFAKGITDVKVVVTSGPGSQFTTELMTDIKGNFFKAQGDSVDMFTSIELAAEGLKSQLSKFAEKRSEKGRESIRHFEPTSLVPEPLKEENNGPKIVKRKQLSAKPMHEEEAILQMELLKHRSFVFINSETFEPCMTYKRNDGNYGIIELG